MHNVWSWLKSDQHLANQETLTDFHGDEAKNCFLKKQIQNSPLRFSKLPILEKFSQTFYGLVQKPLT